MTSDLAQRVMSALELRRQNARQSQNQSFLSWLLERSKPWAGGNSFCFEVAEDSPIFVNSHSFSNDPTFDQIRAVAQECYGDPHLLRFDVKEPIFYETYLVLTTTAWEALARASKPSVEIQFHKPPKHVREVVNRCRDEIAKHEHCDLLVFPADDELICHPLMLDRPQAP